MPETPTLAGIVRLPAPIFLRKLRRKTDWGSRETPADIRAGELVRSVFRVDPKPYSLFRVETDEDLHRVIIGIKDGQLSLTNESDFVAIRPDELALAGIEAISTLGETLCQFVNRLHYDIEAEDGQLLLMCRHLIDQEREVIHLTKGQTRPLAEKARIDGCLVVPTSAGCRVARCT